MQAISIAQNNLRGRFNVWMSLVYRTRIATDINEAYEMDFLDTWSSHIPCESLRNSVARFMETNPVDLSTRDAYFLWAIDLIRECTDSPVPKPSREQFVSHWLRILNVLSQSFLSGVT